MVDQASTQTEKHMLSNEVRQAISTVMDAVVEDSLAHRGPGCDDKQLDIAIAIARWQDAEDARQRTAKHEHAVREQLFCALEEDGTDESLKLQALIAIERATSRP
jgi:hypothetical protein